MEIKVESLSKVKKKINIEIPAARVSSEIEKSYDEIAKRAAIKGFRKGKVPRSLVEKHYSDAMEQDVVKKLVNESYFKALDDEKLNPVSYPEIENKQLKKGEPFHFSAVVEVFPEVVVREFEGLQVNREKYQPNEEAVNRRLDEMREHLAQLKPVEEERPAALGDFVVFDFEGFVDDVVFEGGKGEDFQLELGSGRFIPGFEDQLVGMKAGENHDINVTFPEEYGQAALAGKEARFAIKLKEIKIKELPQLDDDFATGAGDYENLDELRTELKKSFEKQEKERIESDFREGLIKALIDRNDFEVPSALVTQQLEMMLENTKKRLAYQKLSLEMMGLDEERYKIQFRPVAESQVKGSLLLDALATQLDIKIDETDINEQLRKMSGDYGQSLDAVKKHYQQNGKARENLQAQIREDKAIEILIEKAKVTEVSSDKIQQ